jgi:hypothetical protein
MYIIVDCTTDGKGNIISTAYFNASSDPANTVTSPVDNKSPMQALDYLKWLSANPVEMAQAGWSTPTALPGLPHGTTRWQALMNQVQSPSADPAVQAIGLV